MNAELIVFGQLYWPVLAALAALAAILVTRNRSATLSTDHDTQLSWDISLGFISVPVRFKQSWFLYGFFTCAALWAVSFALTRDYSSFFPSKLRMEVFYDRAGIEKTLRNVGLADSIGLSVSRDWWTEREHYYRLLDQEAAPSLSGLTQFFTSADTDVHSVGETTFVVRKVGGWQNYHIEQSAGEVLHTLERPNMPKRTLLTSFEKLETSGDYLRPTFTEMAISRTFVMRPRFKQYLSAKRMAESVPFKVTVVGVTSVRLFPIPQFSSTLYLADVPRVGLVPIAYAVYIPDGSTARGASE